MEKERYSDFKAPDFLLDDDFVAWIEGNDPTVEADWQQWLADNPVGRAEVEKARLLLQGMSFQHQNLDAARVDAAWHQLSGKVHGTPAAVPETESAAGRVIPLWFRLVAASILLIVGVWVGKGYYYPSHQTLAQMQTTNGQQITAKLADGTSVQLNAGSVLTYPEAFPADRREVRLKGEAYFEVAPDSAAPFLIRTGDVDVQVLGTKFTIKAYPESELVKVAVVEGKVAVHPTGQNDALKGEKVFLTKDEMATVEKTNQTLRVTGYDKNDMLGWQNGILYFKKANFSQIMNQLERWYGVEISVADNVEMDTAWRLSGKFENKSIPYILDVCRYPNLFIYQISGKNVHITKP